jgi:hypothetical protein
VTVGGGSVRHIHLDPHSPRDQSIHSEDEGSEGEDDDSVSLSSLDSDLFDGLCLSDDDDDDNQSEVSSEGEE